MATVTKDMAHRLPEPGFGGAPYGNLTALDYQFKTNASGIMVDSDKTTAVASGDVVILGVLPAGIELKDLTATISDAFTASTTMDLGFKYVDGVDSTAVPQDADYFFDGTSTAAAAVLRKTNATAPLQLPKDAYLTLTVGGAAHASAGQMDISVIGVIGG